MPHAIINTIHAIINKSYTIINYPMLLLTKDAIINQFRLLSAKPILLSDTSYSDTSTTHFIIKHIILLSTPQPIILTLHIILLFYSAALAHRCTTGRALA